MDYFNNEVYGFGNNTNEEYEQANNFNYDSISGLGESDYENEDLFGNQVEPTENVENSSNIYSAYDYKPDNYDFGNVGYVGEIEQNDLISDADINDSLGAIENSNLEKTLEFKAINPTNYVNVFENKNNSSEDENYVQLEPQVEEVQTVEPDFSNIFNQEVSSDGFELKQDDQPVEIEPSEPSYNIDMFSDGNNSNIEENQIQLEPQVTEQSNEDIESLNLSIEEEMKEEPVEEEHNEIIVSDTPIEELNELTKFEEDKIEETDINSLFDKVSVNVKDASDIFRKNTDIKQKIDTRFEELKKLHSELENARKKQMDEINKYKEEVLDKLTEKKEEIERRLNILKESQSTLEKEKKEFELYKKREQENIDRVQREVQSAYDDRREELSHIEDVLRKQKDALDEERNQLSLDKIQYEADKNELANNLLKFNEIVDSFTNGVNDIKG